MKKPGLILTILVVVSLFYGGFVLGAANGAGNNNGGSQGSGNLIDPLLTEEPTAKPTSTPKPTATPKPIVFGLTTPKNNALLRDLTEPIAFEWYEEKGALTYTFTVLQISGNTRALGPIYTTTVDAETNCVQKVCSLDYALETGESGVYSWTIEATLPGDEKREPSNAAFVFTVNLEPIELISNGGFENPSDNLAAAIPSSWKHVNASGERRECRADKLPQNVSGLCAYKSTAGPVALLNQSAASNLLKTLKIARGDTLTVNASVQATSTVPAKSRFRIQLQFANGTKQTINVPLDAAPGEVFAAITPKSTALGNNKPAVSKLTVQIVSASKFLIDDVSVILEPVEASLLVQDNADADAISGDLRGK